MAYLEESSCQSESEADGETNDVVLKIVQGRGLAFSLEELQRVTAADLDLGQAGQLVHSKISDLGLGQLALYVFHLDGQSWFWLTDQDLFLTCVMCCRNVSTKFTVFRSLDPALARFKTVEAALGLPPAFVGFWTWVGTVNFPWPVSGNPDLELPDYLQWTDVDPEVHELLEQDS
jgi:hypothetical protein